jgi:hypothetical protein
MQLRFQAGQEHATWSRNLGCDDSGPLMVQWSRMLVAVRSIKNALRGRA